jgi:methionyl-tRNA synthetase
MPATCQTLWESLGAQATMGDISNQKISDVSTPGLLPAGSVVTKGAVLFPRLEDKAE